MRTILFFVTEWLPVRERIHLFLGISQEIEGGISSGRPKPFRVMVVTLLRDQDDHTNTPSFGDRQRFVQTELPVLINDPAQFNSLHNDLQCSSYSNSFTIFAF